MEAAVEPSRAGVRPLASDHLASALQRERARSDRNGREFSLVVLRTPDDGTAARVVERLVDEVRLTDEVGWLGRREPCALLTESGAEGADAFATRLRATLAAEGLTVEPRVLVYPSRWHDSNHGAPPDRPPPSRTPGSRRKTVNPDSGIGLETLFVRPLPAWKRLIDVVGAVVALVVFSPLMLLVTIAIRLDSSGPAIFRQQRAGLGGRPFWMFKFRTMVNGAEKQIETLRPLNEQDGPAFKLTNDPRITRVGRLLRKTSIDELPQLWNVLKGDMSLVGPRPLPVRESEDCRQWHRARLDVTPGLTCTWQVNGRCNTNFDRWVRMDLDYVRRRSLWTDLKLLVMTIPAVLLQRGAK